MRALLALAAALLLPASAAAAPLRVKGGRLVDGRGRTVVLHGVNVAYKVAPYHPNGAGERTSFDREDVARLRGWGMNSIRLGVTWKALEPAPGAIDESYLAEIARISRLAARRGLYVLVDMHQDEWSERYRGNGAPEWATIDDGILFPPVTPGHPYDYLEPAIGRAFTSFWENRDGVRTRFVAAFARLAAQLRGEDGVLGYDAFNEPSCEIQRAPCGLPPDPGAGAKWLAPFYGELLPAMHAADPRHPVFYEDFLTTAFGYPSTLEGAMRRGQGLSYHVYCPHPLRSERSCEDLEREAVQRSVGDRPQQRRRPAADRVRRHGRPRGRRPDRRARRHRRPELALLAVQDLLRSDDLRAHEPRGERRRRVDRRRGRRGEGGQAARPRPRLPGAARGPCGALALRPGDGRLRPALPRPPRRPDRDLAAGRRPLSPRLPRPGPRRPGGVPPQREAAGGPGDHQPRARARR